MPRNVNAPDTEPEEKKFELPSEKEHLFMISDFWFDKKDADIIMVKCEVCGGEEEGRSLLQRVILNDQEKSFYYTRLFLKAIGQPYKGEFEINENHFPGLQFYATIIHNGNYANFDQYSEEKNPVNKAWDEESGTTESSPL